MAVAIHANGGWARSYFERNLKIDLMRGRVIQRCCLIVHEDLRTGEICRQGYSRCKLWVAERELISEDGRDVALGERFSAGERSVIDRPANFRNRRRLCHDD